MAVRRTREIVLWIWVGVTIVASLVVLYTAIQQSGSTVRAGEIALGFWFPPVTTLLGTLIAFRQPENRIAWLLVGIGFAVLAEFFLQLFLSIEPHSPSSLDLLAIVLVHIALPAAIYLAFLTPLMFPTGRFFTRRQALMAWPGAIMLVILPLTTILTGEIGPPYPPEGHAWTVENPVGFLPTRVQDIAISSMMVVLVLTAVAGVFSLAIRYRRSSVITKAQIRWILFSTSIVGVVFLLLAITDASKNALGGLLLLIAFISMPVSITVAITRYRLFEIDRIISRTLSYVVVVAALAAAFFGLVSMITVVLPIESSLAVATSTLAVAALFNPLRKRVQKTIDRRFNRSAYHAEIISAAFASRLREAQTTTQIVDEWERTVNESLQPEASGVWIKHLDNATEPETPHP